MTADASLAGLQARIGHRFGHPGLLIQALTHRSFSADHNERLEFLGDAVLNLGVASLLFQRLQSLPEGDLSRARAKLVRQDTLHQLALDFGLPTHLRLGEGELRSGGQARASILADALEAVIGAVYLDAGFDAASALVHRLYERVDITPRMSAAAKDAKTGLQEWLQARRMQLPVYRVAATRGAAHQQVFDVHCEVKEWALSAPGSGPTRRAAEQAAAEAMLVQLHQRGER